MILDNLIKAAFKLINTVAPSLSPEIFLDAMRDDFDPNLTDEENKQKMMGKIRDGKLGKPLADVASSESNTDKSFEEMLEENPLAKTVLNPNPEPRIEDTLSGGTGNETAKRTQQK